MLLTRADGRISRKVKMEERRHLNNAAQREFEDGSASRRTCPTTRRRAPEEQQPGPPAVHLPIKARS